MIFIFVASIVPLVLSSSITIIEHKVITNPTYIVANVSFNNGSNLFFDLDYNVKKTLKLRFMVSYPHRHPHPTHQHYPQQPQYQYQHKQPIYQQQNPHLLLQYQQQQYHHSADDQYYPQKPIIYELKQYENFISDRNPHPQNNNSNNNNNNSSSNNNHNYYYNNNEFNHLEKNQYFPPFNTDKLVKMQREEIIIERSQLVNNIANNHHHQLNDSNHHHHHHHHHHGIPSASNGNILHRSHHFTQIVAALAVSLGPLAAGLGKGYASPAIASLQELQISPTGNYSSFTVSDQQASWVASLSLLGALFGGAFGGFALQYGRKRVLTVMSLPFSLAWILTVFAKSVETMFLTAFIGGFCCAIVSMVTQVYISEISSPDIRGFLSAIQKISGHFGILISYLLGAYLDWRQLAMLVSIAPMMLFFTVIYIPETPSFLVLKGRDEEAYQSLQWLRGPNKNVELELDTIRSNIQAAKATLAATDIALTTTTTSTATSTIITQKDMKSPNPLKSNVLPQIDFDAIYANVKSVLRNVRLVKPVLITCGLMVFQRFTGANSFGFYAVKVFRQTFAGMNPHGGAIAVGFVQLLASMLSGLLIDTVGRIPLLITSSVFMSLALASFGSFVYYEQMSKTIASNNYEMDAAVGNSDWIPLLCVLVFTIAFSLGISPISWLLIGELFPLEYRAIGSSIATSFSYFCAFLGVKTFVDFQEIFGLHGAFWLYACISCLGLFFVIMVVPETKGREMDEMNPKYIQTLTINR